MTDELTLRQVCDAMISHGVARLYTKPLARNDNSKNQPYLGGDFAVLNVLPARDLEAAPSGRHAEPAIFKAALDFWWLGYDGSIRRAPEAKLILYPQYPEVRLSGYLTGVDLSHRPSKAMGATRTEGRVLLIGVTAAGRLICAAAREGTPLAKEVLSLEGLEEVGVLRRVPLGSASASAERQLVLQALCGVASKGWIDSRRLASDGTSLDCEARNCGGYTLEAELGVTPNGLALPDFMGWEVKQHAVGRLDRPQDGPITLMTPEPNGGLYAERGVLAFLDKYGYPDKTGRANRRNFGGIHRCGVVERTTGLRLELHGFDSSAGTISDAGGGIYLVDRQDTVAALWRFDGLLTHWRRKHAQAVYVPCVTRHNPGRQYRYGDTVRLGAGTTFELFLRALESGHVYLDPGIKAENYPAKPVIKRRSQFRVKSSQIARLYHALETVSACDPGSP